MRNDYQPISVQQPLIQTYESLEFALANGQTNYNVKSNVNGAFTRLKSYTTLSLRTDQNISIKLNTTSGDTITIPLANSPFEFDNLVEIENIFITNNSGSTANIKIIGVNKGGPS